MTCEPSIGLDQRDTRLHHLELAAQALRNTVGAAAVICWLSAFWCTWLAFWETDWGSELGSVSTLSLVDLLTGWQTHHHGTDNELSLIAQIAAWLAVVAPVVLLGAGLRAGSSAQQRTGRRILEAWVLVAGVIGVIICVITVRAIGFDQIPGLAPPRVGAGLPFLVLSLVLSAGFRDLS